MANSPRSSNALTKPTTTEGGGSTRGDIYQDRGEGGHLFCVAGRKLALVTLLAPLLAAPSHHLGGVCGVVWCGVGIG